MKRFVALISCLLFGQAAWAETYSFGVTSLRSATLTAQYWNPILDWVSKKSGVTLELAMRKTAQEFSDATARSEFDFVYSNHIFTPAHSTAAYQVIARMAGNPIHGQIVVPEASPLRTLHELKGMEMGFPSLVAFLAYAVPMSALIQEGIAVKPVLGGNMEGIIAQLRSGTIPVASVNSSVMQAYGAREHFKYRALWTSEPYLDLPIAAHPRIPRPAVKAVREALTSMAADAEGLKILKESDASIKQNPPWGFVPAEDAEYRNQREVYRIIWKKQAR